jgi:hypothetical protein
VLGSVQRAKKCCRVLIIALSACAVFACAEVFRHLLLTHGSAAVKQLGTMYKTLCAATEGAVHSQAPCAECVSVHNIPVLTMRSLHVCCLSTPAGPLRLWALRSTSPPRCSTTQACHTQQTCGLGCIVYQMLTWFHTTYAACLLLQDHFVCGHCGVRLPRGAQQRRHVIHSRPVGSAASCTKC